MLNRMTKNKFAYIVLRNLSRYVSCFAYGKTVLRTSEMILFEHQPQTP